MREELPEVVLTTTTSVDGRITLGRDQLLLDPSVGGRQPPGHRLDRHADLADDLGRCGVPAQPVGHDDALGVGWRPPVGREVDDRRRRVRHQEHVAGQVAVHQLGTSCR
jgi:hypothetical protein